VRFDLSGYRAVPPITGIGTLGLVGDLVELKNHLQAVELVRRLRARGHELRLLLVGRDVSGAVPRSRAYAELVREAVAAMPAAELVSALPERMPDQMARLDALLAITSVPESFGRVCVEAMAAGRPVIGYDHGGVAELVEDGRNGILCPPGDLAAVERAVEALASDPARAIAMGAVAREDAVARFSAAHDRGDTIGDALADFAIAATAAAAP
jgi:glycosyltransferase involved in cell wall biosynthesis